METLFIVLMNVIYQREEMINIRRVNEFQKIILEIQTDFSPQKALFRGKETLDGKYVYGMASVVSIGSANCFTSIDGKKVIEKTIAVSLPNIRDKYNRKLYCSVNGNGAGDETNFNGRIETLNYDKRDNDEDGSGVSTYMFRWETLKENIKFVSEPDFDTI